MGYNQLKVRLLTLKKWPTGEDKAVFLRKMKMEERTKKKMFQQKKL